MTDFCCRDGFIRKLESEPGDGPFSWTFIFGNAYAEKRNRVVFDRGQRTTVLSVILDSLTEETRSTIFPCTFDLGNCRNDCLEHTRHDFVHELDSEFGTSESPITDDNIRYTQETIGILTGKPFGMHVERNSIKAYKVLKLFVRIQRQRSSSLRAFLKPVSQRRASMEHRDRYPFPGKLNNVVRDNSDQVWLLADLKSYFEIELDTEEIYQVKHIFSSLLSRVESRVNADAGTLRFKCEGELRAAYETMIANISESCRTAAQEDAGYNLDKLIYIYLHALEFAHFAAEFEQLVESTIPRDTIVPIVQEIEELPDLLCYSDGSPLLSNYVRISDALQLYRVTDYDGPLCAFVAIATGYAVTENDYELLASRSAELLSRYHRYKDNRLICEAKRVPICHLVAAICAVWQEMCHQTQYRAFWFGQQSQGKTILRFLDAKHDVLDESTLAQPYPEVADQIWSKRFEWMSEAIQGRQPFVELRLKHEVALLNMASSLVMSLDITHIEAVIRDELPEVNIRTMEFVVEP